MEKGESRAKLMAEYGVGSSTLYNQKKKKKKKRTNLSFVASTYGPTGKIQKRKMLRGPKMQELDSALYMWFQARHSEGKAVSEPALTDEVKKLKEDLEIEGECNFSMGWLRNFKERHGIRRLKVQGERNSADHNAAENFTKEFQCLIREHKVSPEQVHNADETALFWCCLSTSTLSAYTEREAVGFKVNNDHVMMLPCANAAGTHKCKLLVVGRYKKPRASKNMVHPPVHYNASEKCGRLLPSLSGGSTTISCLRGRSTFIRRGCQRTPRCSSS